jgi:hypothetical protein
MTEYFKELGHNTLKLYARHLVEGKANSKEEALNEIEKIKKEVIDEKYGDKHEFIGEVYLSKRKRKSYSYKVLFYDKQTIESMIHDGVLKL